MRVTLVVMIKRPGGSQQWKKTAIPSKQRMNQSFFARLKKKQHQIFRMFNGFLNNLQTKPSQKRTPKTNT